VDYQQNDPQPHGRRNTIVIGCWLPGLECVSVSFGAISSNRLAVDIVLPALGSTFSSKAAPWRWVSSLLGTLPRKKVWGKMVFSQAAVNHKQKQHTLR
jgi:hypothetical protein